MNGHRADFFTGSPDTSLQPIREMERKGRTGDPQVSMAGKSWRVFSPVTHGNFFKHLYNSGTNGEDGAYIQVFFCCFVKKHVET